MLQKLTILLCLISLFVCNIVGAEAAQYKINKLTGIDPAADSWAYGINNNGQIVGVSCKSLGSGYEESYAARWIDSIAQIINLPGGSSTSAYDISENGVVTGIYYSVGGSHAYMLNGNTLTDIGASTRGLGISCNGLCISGYRSGNAGYLQPFAYINNTVVNIGNLGGNGDSFAFDINDSGKVVGSSYQQDGYQQAFLWQNNTIVNLDTSGGHESRAMGISNDDKVVGYAYTSDNQCRAFVWQNGKMNQLCDLVSKAWAISPNGRYIVGEVTTPSHSRHQAALWVDGQLTILGSLPEASSDYSIANSVNDYGVAVGYAVGADYNSYAVTWMPVPEPSSIIVLICGIALAMLIPNALVKLLA